MADRKHHSGMNGFSIQWQEACVPLLPREELEADRPEFSLLILDLHFKSLGVSFQVIKPPFTDQSPMNAECILCGQHL